MICLAKFLTFLWVNYQIDFWDGWKGYRSEKGNDWIGLWRQRDMTEKKTYSDHFKLEHILVLALPFYMVLTRRYVVIPLSLDMALFSFFLYAAYHSPVLHISSLLSGFNLNYALVPPACKL